MAELSDPRRLTALDEAGLLDSPPEEAFDRMTRLAARLLGVPVALVSIVDAERQFFKSQLGLPEPYATERGTPLSHSFCQHVVTSGEPLVVDDARHHLLVRANQAVPDIGVIAYAGVPLADADGNVLGAMCAIERRPRAWKDDEIDVLRDLAAAATAEIELRRAANRARRAQRDAEHRFQTLVEQLPTVTYICDYDETATVRYISPQIEEWTGYSPRCWTEDAGFWQQVIHSDDVDRVAEKIEHCIAEEVPYEDEYRIVAADGRVLRVWEREVIVADGLGRYSSQGVLVDVTARRRDEERIAFLAYHDQLTGLANRRRLEEQLEGSLARARRTGRGVALLFLDIDDFKVVNDSLGHAAGDELLRQVSARVTDVMRGTDLLARHGGDEFLLLLDDLEGDAEAAAESVAAKVLSAFSAPFRHDDTEFRVSASIGISLWPDHGQQPAELLRHADVAMYQAKRGARGRWAVYAAGGEDARSRLTFSARLARAIAEDELVLHYQPIVDITQPAPFALEALVRWQDPVAGLISPAYFIPAAEESGLIHELGAWVVDAVCRQMTEWERRGLSPIVGFNLSPRQLERSDVAHALRGIVERHGIEPGRLTVEITESAAMAAPERTDPLLGELEELGVRLVVDDFGVAYSSLSRLRELSVDALKIDRSMLVGVPEDANAAAIIRAIIALGKALRIGVVAEGVESDAQRRFLLDEGCRLAQGFGLQRPMPADATTAYLLEHAPARERAWQPA